MKPIIEFFQSLGLAEIIVTVLLIAVCVYGYFDSRKIDKRLDNDLKWFDGRNEKGK